MSYRAEIIAVGTELLLGNVANTDAQFLSEQLAAVGVDVLYHTAVGDNPARLEEVIAIARRRADLLIFTGGLGPTYDDLTKETVCRAAFPLAERYGFRFLGGHPMAGTHNSGFKYSRGDLFDGAPMVIVPPSFEDIRLLDEAKNLLAPVGFGRVSFTTAEDHDKKIAFTSQMAHVVSNAYIKSPTARAHDGFSAGSYKDLTRVAWLNPAMWTELFLENKENLLYELDVLIDHLTQYRDAMEQEDSAALCRLLDEGRRIKEEVDGK